MPSSIRVGFVLPYWLQLEPGEFVVLGQRLRAEAVEPAALPGGSGEAGEPRVVFSTLHEAPDDLARDAAQAKHYEWAVDLVHHANEVIRLYRHITGQYRATELVIAEAAPFTFEVDATGERWGPNHGILEWERGSLFLPAGMTPESVASELREGLARNVTPEPAALLLLDAKEAREAGRYREAVLLSWSAIEAAFSAGFARRVKSARSGDDASMLLDHRNMSLLNRMTAGLQYVAGRSFADIDVDGWLELRQSYKKRNSIIHHGDGATDGHATQAIGVAAHVQDVLNQLAAPSSDDVD